MSALCRIALLGEFSVQYEESLGIRREIGDRDGIAESLEAFASLVVTERTSEHAALLWGTAKAMREEIGSLRPPSERERYNCGVAEVRRMHAHRSWHSSRPSRQVNGKRSGAIAPDHLPFTNTQPG